MSFCGTSEKEGLFLCRDGSVTQGHNKDKLASESFLNYFYLIIWYSVGHQYQAH